MKNKDVVAAWKNGRALSCPNFSTDGENLYSYRLKIGITEDGGKYVYDYRSGGMFVSVTTSRHVGMAAVVATLLPPSDNH
jgi:hypothetical protein